jgi:hypothetical protein
VEHCRDDKFHLVYVPAIDKYTQARRLGEIGPMACELFALETGVPIERICVLEYRTHTPAIG